MLEQAFLIVHGLAGCQAGQGVGDGVGVLEGEMGDIVDDARLLSSVGSDGGGGH